MIALSMILLARLKGQVCVCVCVCVCACVYYKEPVVVMLLPVILNGRTSNVRGQRTDRVVLVIVRVSDCLFSLENIMLGFEAVTCQLCSRKTLYNL